MVLGLVPVNSDGKTLPQIFFKGSEHLGGNIDFEATINVKDGESKKLQLNLKIVLLYKRSCRRSYY
jgi:hypothetical protein